MEGAGFGKAKACGDLSDAELGCLQHFDRQVTADLIPDRSVILPLGVQAMP